MRYTAAERRRSAAPESGSETRADAVGCRLQRFVRQDVLPLMILAHVLRARLQFCRVGTQILPYL
jgi:hypothetical protein